MHCEAYCLPTTSFTDDVRLQDRKGSVLEQQPLSAPCSTVRHVSVSPQSIKDNKSLTANILIMDYLISLTVTQLSTNHDRFSLLH